MKYLLIDFGASYIKTVIYNTITEEYTNQINIDSPFLTNTEVHKNDLLRLLQEMVEKNSECNSVYICTILGGFYEGDVYYSWKSNKPRQKNYCLVSGLFTNTETFHVHEHHKEFTNVNEYSDRLKILGFINSKPIYSSLGDTFCVINSVDIDDHSVGINLGTGSQVFYMNSGKLITKMYIPSGRTFLTFQNFFHELNFDFFSAIDRLTVNDVLKSTLEIDLNTFPQSHKFSTGGSIQNIMEETLTVKNLISSILSSYVRQYVDLIPTDKKQIYLLGGMAAKIKILPDLFKIYCPGKTVTLCDESINSTHKGIIKLIKNNGK